MTLSPSPVFIFAFFTSNVVNDFRIVFSWFLYHVFEGFSPNVPSFFATYFGKISLQIFLFPFLLFRQTLGDTYSTR